MIVLFRNLFLNIQRIFNSFIGNTAAHLFQTAAVALRRTKDDSLIWFEYVIIFCNHQSPRLKLVNSNNAIVLVNFRYFLMKNN